MFLNGLMRAIAKMARPYIWLELPAWGRVFQLFAGDYRREWLWQGQRASVVDKKTGYKLDLDLGWWSDRMTYFLGRWYDLHSQLIINHIKPGDLVLDIGANRGMFALYASKRAAKVICFEPNPQCLQVLNRTIADNRIQNIEVRSIGLSDKNETLDLFVPASDTGIATFSGYEGMEGKSISCTVRIGDEELAGLFPAFIKIDVEGFEPRVIAGLSHTLRTCRPKIYMEFVSSHLERAGSSSAALIDLMERLGYRGQIVSHRSRTSTECTYRDLIDPMPECDVLWISRDLRTSG